jgi:hypothetical protein
MKISSGVSTDRTSDKNLDQKVSAAKDSDGHCAPQTSLLKELRWKGDSSGRPETQCASIVNLIQMERMKVICNMQNMMSQEFTIAWNHNRFK